MFSYSKKGFTLVELLVVIAIIGIMVAILFWGESDSRTKLVAKSTANEIASSLRQVQVWGTSTRTGEAPEGDTIDPDDGYGIYFDIDSNSYITFADLNQDDEYDDEELLMEQFLTRGYQFLDICVGSGPDDCDSEDNLSIVVRRPEMNFLFGDDYASIVIGNNEEAHSRVSIWSSGRFEVQLVQDAD